MMLRTWGGWPLVAVCSLMVWGCPERDGRFLEGPGLSGPVLAKGALVYASTGRRALLVMDPASGAVTTIPLSGRPTRVEALAGGQEVLALVPEAETLDVVVVATGAVRSYDLGSAFDSVVASDDGRFAVAAYAGGQAQGLSNASEVAVLDLSQAPSDTNPTVRTLSSAGGVPIGIDVSPSFGGDDRRLALIRSTNHIAAVDLRAPEGATRSIPLVAPGSAAKVIPQAPRMRVDGDVLNVFLLAQGLDDVLHLRFDGSMTGDGAPLPSLNQFAVGQGPADLALWERSDGVLHVVTVNRGSRDIALVEVETARTTVLPVDEPLDHLLLDASGNLAQALAWRQGAVTLHRVALEQVAVKKSKALTTLSLVNSVDSVTPVGGGDWLLVGHPQAAAAVTLVEADGGRIVPFTGAGRILGVELSSDDARVFVLSFSQTGTQLGVIDVATGHPESVALGFETPTGLLRVPGTDWLALPYARDLGAVRLIAAAGEELEQGRVIEGFLMTGILDTDGGAK